MFFLAFYNLHTSEVFDGILFVTFYFVAFCLWLGQVNTNWWRNCLNRLNLVCRRMPVILIRWIPFQTC